jgi:hypothetical protein
MMTHADADAVAFCRWPMRRLRLTISALMALRAFIQSACLDLRLKTFGVLCSLQNMIYPPFWCAEVL